MTHKKSEEHAIEAREERDAFSRLFELLLAEREQIIQADNIKLYDRENSRTISQ